MIGCVKWAISIKLLNELLINKKGVLIIKRLFSFTIDIDIEINHKILLDNGIYYLKYNLFFLI